MLAVALDDRGQASVEAALLLPSLLVVIGLLAQPVCVGYTRCVMEAAAGEACRLMSTATHGTIGSDSAYESYVRRRLDAVPDLDIFHRGGDAGWEIELSGSVAEHGASARIRTTVRPLPIVGLLAVAAGDMDEAGDVVVDVSVATTTRPSWLEGGYGDWSSSW